MFQVSLRTLQRSLYRDVGISIIGGIQPSIINNAMDDGNKESGLLARLLIAMPERYEKTFSEDDIDPYISSDFEKAVYALYDIPVEQDESGEPKPQDIDITPEAKILWGKFVDSHDIEARRSHNDQAAAFYAKIEATAARFALIIHCCKVISSQTCDTIIGVETMQEGIGLAKWFLYEGLRVYRIFSENATETKLRKMLERVRVLGGRVKPSAWQRDHKSRLKSVEAARGELELLVTHDYAKWEKRQSDGGGRPSEDLVLI